MNLTEVLERRPSILLAVVVAHVALVYLAMHVAWRPMVPRLSGYDPIRLLPLPKTTSPLSPAAPTTPSVDWDQEALAAIQESLLAAEKHKQYRDLSGLLAAQLEWVRQNQMVPMPPSFQWDHRRRDNGNPLGVIWIGQHCVLVWLIPFCQIGHIEANGELFEHMRDPKEP